ncbi:fimbrial biogenesis outer membrane usher protein [Morganella psychrotolerans]|uniref:Fimbrial biogenesis outer membrane usher protein n=1 Tax=Morganella psychrotolerans TaxID=368603 RepID=A0A5M9R606_9GAMM|nr:fimbria/pilus outer membrane usher protein [Morganella psychrotolerans]KAA8715356.1 fimbrial biogenesis outer membrane usher protein [Morganella psychrotolerans]OBU05402.1 fimbrial assembly protein [Morganella psychrotolerans]
MKCSKFRICLLSSLICWSFYSYSDDYFDPAMLDSQLGIDPTQVDLSQFAKDDSIPTGKFAINIQVNRNNLGDQVITFVPDADGKTVPELTPALLESWGVNIKAISQLNILPPDTVILNLPAYVPDSGIQVNIADLTMKISIPQIAMTDKAEGFIDPSLLDDGIPAMFLSYFVSGSRNRNDTPGGAADTNDTAFATVQSGINLGAWRARSTGSYSRSRVSGNTITDTNFSNTYITRAFHQLRSVLTLGESVSSSDVFDSIPFRGGKLGSDEQMLPASLRGFAPEVSGIATSNARVTVRQNGYVVYQTYVAPGPFSLKDISPSGNTGDLDVTVTEENGTEKTFTIAFSSLPVMLRPGGIKYEVVAGQYDGGITQGSKKSTFASATGIYGLPGNVTLYGGVLAAESYLSAAGGAGISLGVFGALSADITHASAELGGDTGQRKGQSFRLRYSKSMTTTGTSVDLTALRYSTRDYFSFADFNNHDYRLKDGVSPWLNQRQRSSFTTSLSQSLGDYGNLYLSGSIYDFWGSDSEVRQISAGYNGSYKSVSYSLNYSIDRIKSENSWPENRQFSVNISVPFSIFSNNTLVRGISSTYTYSQDNNGRVNQQAGLSGSALDNRFTYGISQSYANKGQGNSGNVYTNYSGSKGTASLGYNYSKDYRSVNGSVGGSLVIHSGGILAGQSLGSSLAIIEAPGADGTHISNQKSVINSGGYGLYPYVSPYNANIISLDVNTLPDNVMLNETTKTVYPTAGAIVKAKFNTKVGYQAIINLKLRNGTMLPFGAVATLADSDTGEENTGIVGDNNQLFMSGLPESGNLYIGWGNGQKQQCRVTFTDIGKLPVSQGQPIRIFDAVCE